MRNRIRFSLVSLLSLVLFSIASAQYDTYTYPQLLEELNNDDYPAGDPTLSRDGLTIYFSRYEPGLGYRLFVATRPTLEDQFNNIQRLTTLENGHAQGTPYISNNNLRLYYQEYIGTEYYVKMAYRPSTDWPWLAIRTFNELHVAGFSEKSPTFTGDELTIFFNSQRPYNGTSQGRIWTATRTSVTAAFGTPQVVPELIQDDPDFGVNSPTISSDGLQLTFGLHHGDYQYNQLYYTHRFSLNQEFVPYLPWELSYRREIWPLPDPWEPTPWEPIDWDAGFYSAPYFFELPDHEQLYFYAEAIGGEGIWVAPYNPPHYCNPVDYNCDDIVDLLDFAVFAENWLWGDINRTQ